MKERIEHIWEYYRYQILIGILFVIILTTVVPPLFDRPISTWRAFYINSEISAEDAQELADDFKLDVLGIETDEHEIAFDTTMRFTTTDASSIAISQMARFTAFVAGKEVDLVVSDQGIINHYGQLGGFIHLDDLLTEEQLLEWEDRLYYVIEDEGDGKEQPIAIEISEGMYASVPLNSEKTRVSVQFINFLIDEIE